MAISAPYPIWLTNDTNLYRDARVGEFTYTFTVPNGTYRVKLKFSEDEDKFGGQRRFNAAINGKAVLSDFDIVGNTGVTFTAIDKTFYVTVTDGAIRVAFTNGSVGSPTISAIEILQ